MKKYILFAAAALTLAACTNDNEPVTPADGEVAARIVADIDYMATRASGDSWAMSDKIGITSTSTDNKTDYANMPYEYNGTIFEVPADGKRIYFQSPAEVTFHAYYPFTGTSGKSAGTLEVFTNADAQKDLTKIDYLFATGAKADKAHPEVKFTDAAAFRHCMSQITLEFAQGDDMLFEGDNKLTAYSLKGLDLNGTFNTETGETVATDGTAPEAGLKILLEDVTVTDNKYTADPVILLPQEVNGKIALEVTVEGETYKATLNLPNIDNEPQTALRSGYHYKFPVRVTKKGLTVGKAEITDWTTVTGGGVDAEM